MDASSVVPEEADKDRGWPPGISFRAREIRFLVPGRGIYQLYVSSRVPLLTCKYPEVHSSTPALWFTVSSTQALSPPPPLTCMREGERGKKGDTFMLT